MQSEDHFKEATRPRFTFANESCAPPVNVKDLEPRRCIERRILAVVLERMCCRSRALSDTRQSGDDSSAQ